MVVFAYDFFDKEKLAIEPLNFIVTNNIFVNSPCVPYFIILFDISLRFFSANFLGNSICFCKIRKIICHRNDDGTRLQWRLWYNPLYGIFMICLMKLMICSQGIMRMELFGNYSAYMNVRWCPNQPARDTCIIIVCSRTCIPINIIHPAKSRIQSDPKPRWPSQNPIESDFQSELLSHPGGSTIIKYEIVYPAISDRVHDHEIHLKHTCMHSQRIKQQWQ